MIPQAALRTIRQFGKRFPMVVRAGPRQSGETALSRMAFPRKRQISLEDPAERVVAREDPRCFVGRFPDGAMRNSGCQRASQGLL